MEVGNLAAWAAVAIALASLLNSWVSARSKASTDAHVALEKRVVALETEQATIRRDFVHLPDKESFHRIEMEIQKLAGTMGIFDAQLKPVAATASRIQDLLDEKVKL